jgi:preprotein translocase subunit SecB
MSKMNGNPEANQQENKEPGFGIHKIYTRDVSFESPNPVELFESDQWEPEIHLDLHTKTTSVRDNLHEVILTLTVTAKGKDKKPAFLVEVQQAGLFFLEGFDKDNLKHMLGSFCPSILFPYGREVIASLVSRGGFPPLHLAPVNFDMLYQHHLEEEQHGKAN